MSNRHRPPFLLLLLLSPFLVPSSLTIFASNLTAVALCLPHQSSALLRLKEGFSTNRSTTNLESWKSGTDCCDHWEGVTCNPASSGRVTALDLSNRSISGRIDSSLFNLTSLTSLNLAYNLFNQRLPSWGFEKLASLTRLNLSNAGFYGQIPSGISRLTKLVSLDLSTFFLDESPSTSLKLLPVRPGPKGAQARPDLESALGADSRSRVAIGEGLLPPLRLVIDCHLGNLSVGVVRPL